MDFRITALLVAITLLAIPSSSHAQLDRGKVMLQVAADIYRSDNDPITVFRRAGVGVDGHYFVADGLALGLGGEVTAGIRNGGGSQVFWNTNLRYYPFGKTFLRLQTRVHRFNFENIELLGGVGYNFFLNKRWAIEVTGDYYFLRVKGFGFRGGISWLL